VPDAEDNRLAHPAYRRQTERHKPILCRKLANRAIGDGRSGHRGSGHRGYGP